MCEDEYLLDLLKSSPYFGAFLGFILFSIISDNFGRRKTMILSLGTASFGCVLLVIGQNISMITVGILLAGAGANPSAVMVFCFLG
jgi:MFS family permease